MPKTRLPLVAALFALLAATVGAVAAEPAPSFATRDQLRQCMHAESELKARAMAIEASDKALVREVDQVQAEATQLASMRAGIAREGDHATGVETFNALARRHNVHVRRLNKDTASAAPASEAFKTDKASYGQTCAAQVYRAEDMAAVNRERAKTASAP